MSLVSKKVLPVFRLWFCVPRLKHSDAVKRFEDIPGPWSFPIVGTQLHYALPGGNFSYKKLHETYTYLYEKYGDLVKEDCNLNRTIVHVFNPDDMFAIYKSDGKFPRRLSHTALGYYRLARPHLYSGQGLLPTNGKDWAHYRNMFKRAMLSPECVDKLGSALEEVTTDLVDTIPTLLDEKLEANLTPLLFRWGLETVCNITLNKRLGCLTREDDPEAAGLIKAAELTHVGIYETESSALHFFTNYRKLEKAQDFLAGVIEKYMNEFLQRKDWKDTYCLLSSLLQCEGATKKDVFTMLVDMFLAGIDSTSFTLSFALYNLAINKDAQDTLRKELMECLPECDSSVADCKKKMKYLRAVFYETLRINPVAIGNGRLLNENLVLSGYEVPANTMVILQHQVASKNDKYFKNATSFQPERWISGQKPTVATTPFGFGYRTCIGAMIAEKEVLIALAKIIRNFEISYHYAPIGSTTKLLNVPDKPLILRLRKL